MTTLIAAAEETIATAARDILANFEISLAVFIPATPRNRAISYTNLPEVRV